MVGTLASRITGLLRTSLLIQLFPAALTDAFLFAWKIPNLFRELLAEGALTNAFVPIYASLPKDEAKRLTGALVSVLTLVNALLVALVMVGAPWLVGLLLTPGANLDAELATTLLRLIFPVLATISWSALAMGVLNAEERFLAPAWAPVALNVVTIVAMLLFPGQIRLLSVAVVLGGLAQLLVQVPALVRAELLPTWGLLWHPSLASVLLLMAPFALTTGARQILNVVALVVLGQLPQGSITAYENASLVLSLALGLFSVSPALAFYSRLSSDAAQRPEQFRQTLLSGLRFITFLTVPVGLLVLILAEPTVFAIWRWSLAEGQAQALAFTITALAPLGLVVFPLGLNNLLLRPFYIRKHVRVPVVISSVFIGVQVVLFSLWGPRYGIVGLSWATVAANWVQLGVLLYWMRRDEGLELTPFFSHALKVWAASAVAVGLALLALQNVALPSNQLGIILRLMVGGGVTVVLYALLTLLLGLPELQQVVRRFRR